MILHAQDCTQHFTELELWKPDNALDTVQVANTLHKLQEAPCMCVCVCLLQAKHFPSAPFTLYESCNDAASCTPTAP